MFQKKSWIFGLTLLAMAGVAQAQSEVPPAVPPTSPTMTPDLQSGGSVSQIQWFTNYQEAVAKAKAEKKPLVLFFTGSDWCGWCKKMENEILSTPEFARTAGSNFVFVMLDFPMNKTLPSNISDQNNDLKQKYGITGYPTIIVLDSNENFVAETGYRSGGGKSYADYLIGLSR